MKTFIDLVNDCDKCVSIDHIFSLLIENSFPYYERSPEEYQSLVSSYFKLYLEGSKGPTGPHGYLPEWVVEAMPWHGRWSIDYTNKRVMPAPAQVQLKSQNDVIKQTVDRARELRTFRVLSGWRNELYPIRGHESQTEKDISMERSASPLFGITTFGVHMTVYTYTDKGMKIWVPRRASTKQTHGGMLDNTVAGGLATGEKPFQCLVREASEEASLSEQLVRSNANSCGTVSYFHVRNSRAGGEVGLLQPECQYVFDMEAGPNVKPAPNDTEVEDFYLWSVEEVKRHLVMGEFKPNCALVLLDFLIRHGKVTAENEVHYIEIVSRIHRPLPFPTAPSCLKV